LLPTRARLIVVTERQLVSRPENAPVPLELWEADGEGALEQNWTAGDFSAQIEVDRHIEAFGVTFGMSGLLELLPPEKRAIVARRLSVAGDPAWVTARVAWQFAWEKAGVNPMTAGSAVLDQARLGFVTGRAVLAQRFDPSRYREADYDDPPAWEEREWDIPTSFWWGFTAPKTSHQDWERGSFIGAGTGPKGSCRMKLEGVHFLTESLQSLLPAGERASSGEALPTEAPAKDNPGGRPTAEWWDDMWCHVIGQIYDGTLTPSSQAAIEKAMHSWANDRGHEPAVSTIRLRARKLYKTLKKVENSLDR
jgi:hypothetical protein